MEPMLVVMHASDVLNAKAERHDDNLSAFETILLEEVLSIVKQGYRTDCDPRRVIGDASLGGATTG